jgi:hypothetical protein
LGLGGQQVADHRAGREKKENKNQGGFLHNSVSNANFTR